MCIYLVCFNLKFLIWFHVFTLRLDVSFGEISELDEMLQGAEFYDVGESSRQV